MTAPRLAPFAPTLSRSPQPLRASEHLAARASLAVRRSIPFARAWTLTLGALAVILLIVPFASGDPRAADRNRAERLAADTLLSAQRLRSAQGAVAAAESSLAAALAESARRPVARAVISPPVAPTLPQRPLTGFETAIQEARRLRTVAAMLAVAHDPAVRYGPRMRALEESLTAYAGRRDALSVGSASDQERADLSQRIGRAGITILAIADNRRAELAAESPADVRVETPAEAPESATIGSSSRSDAAEFRAVLDRVRLTLTGVRRQHDSLSSVLRTLEASLASRQRPVLLMASPAIIVALVLLLGLAVRFTSALRREMKSPTVAHVREAEGVSGALVLATVRDASSDGPARFRPSGVDPFRMLYLGLTTTGTRTRTAVVTGDDPVVAAAVGARLAIAAAADHRATLVVDLDPAEIALSRTFRERAEPGLTDALAGGFKWREVARPIGSSDGLPITLLPAGTSRDDFGTAEEVEARHEEFARFRSAYELTILVAPRAGIDAAMRLVPASPVLIAAAAGETLVAQLAAESAELRASGRRLHGTVLWDAPRPQLPSRADLAALLSKQKGRTPGGSFDAVRRAVKDGIK